MDKRNVEIEKYINSPILFLNYKFGTYNDFIQFIENTFYITMRIENKNDYTLDIYFINNQDILNVNIPQLKLSKIDNVSFFIYINDLEQSNGKIKMKRFIISFKENFNKN